MRNLFLTLIIVLSAGIVKADTGVGELCLDSPRALLCAPGAKPVEDEQGCWKCEKLDAEDRMVKADICLAAKRMISKMADDYITDDLNCWEDSDCKEVNYIGGPMCGPRMMNRTGYAGLKLMQGNSEYKRLSEIVRKQQWINCGPIPRCAPRPTGVVKCISNRCTYDILSSSQN